MRHRNKNSYSFGRKAGPKKALLRGLVASLTEHERIKTTLAKAKALRPLAEKAITRARKGDLHSRRILLSKYPFPKTVAKLMGPLAERFSERPGGYTRIVKLGQRPGDHAPKALIEFVDFQPKPPPTDEEKARLKVSPERAKARKAKALRNQAKRKALRKTQSASRRRNRKP